MERYLGAGFKPGYWSVVVVVLLLLCGCKVPAAWAQSQYSGFRNIDCGATEQYVDNVTGLTWEPDTAYISTGKTQTLLVPASLQTITEMKTVRYFDDTRPKNCYSLPVVAGDAYLLRATFFYGNYDHANQLPSFQLAVDANVLDDIVIADATNAWIYAEHHYVAQSNVTHLCLIRSDTSPLSTPFISGISLKPANELITGFADKYRQLLQDGIIMSTRARVNYGGTEFIRAPADYYDRFWFRENPTSNSYLVPTTSPVQFVSTNRTFAKLLHSGFGPPSAVMQTAVTSSGTIASLIRPSGTVTSAYVSVYFAEMNASGTPTPRNFTVQVPGVNPATDALPGVFLDSYKGRDFWPSVSIGPNSTLTMTPVAGSLGGPILNAMEVFSRSGPRVSMTVDRDALAIEDIKQSLNLTEWTGDPCQPFPHYWITCSSPESTMTQPHITAVNLSGYQLEGAIPPSFAKLSYLTSLSLENNNLSGPLPWWLTSLTQLTVLSVQNNNFSGPIPDGLLSANSQIQLTYKPGNPLLIVGGPLPAPACGNCGKSNVALIVGASIGGVVGLVLIALIIAAFAYRRCQRKPNPSDDQGASGKRIGTRGSAKAYNFAEVTAATNHFNRELGRGGFGPVYYGMLPDGTEVAVKVAHGSSKQEEKEFFNEVDVLSRVHHKNLVALVGYCQEQSKQILIYEYMHNGSLFDHLHGSSVRVGTLDWRMRLHIALNAARGLEYLHTGCNPSFIHRDVKSNNILLSPKYDAKVADFGLTKLLVETDDTRVMTNVMGTPGYVDPEYYRTQYISSKSDVYSFGIVLLELITGRLPFRRSAPTETDANIALWVRERLLSNNIDSVLDPAVKASIPNMEAVWKVAEVAMHSVEPNGVHRPTMSQVVQELQGALTLEGTSSPPPGSHPRLSSTFPDRSCKFSATGSGPIPR